MYDAVMVFATAIQQLGSEQVLPTPIICNQPNSIWNKGYTILNFMKTVKLLRKMRSNFIISRNYHFDDL